MKNKMFRINVIINDRNATPKRETRKAYNQPMVGISKMHHTLESVPTTLNGDQTTIVVNHLEDPVWKDSRPLPEPEVTPNLVTVDGVLVNVTMTKDNWLDVIFHPDYDWWIIKDLKSTAATVGETHWLAFKSYLLAVNVDGGDFDSLEKGLKKSIRKVKESLLDKDVKGYMINMIHTTLKPSRIRKLYGELKDLQAKHLAE